jgi:tetratricopeptide (TPR) repeat protein
VAIDREETLKKAEKLVRQGRIESAIAEYQRVVDAFPRDWNAANALGDCLARVQMTESAAAQYNRIADHFAAEGFYPKAAALYKKSLKLNAGDEHALARLADMATRAGTLVEARQYLQSLADRRRRRGDASGAADALLRIGALDPEDVDARLTGARAAISAGAAQAGAAELHAIADALAERGQHERAIDLLTEALAAVPADGALRSALVRAHGTRGDLVAARAHAETAADLSWLAGLAEAAGDALQAMRLLEAAFAASDGDRTLAERLVRGQLALGNVPAAGRALDALGEVTDPDLLALAGTVRARQGDAAAARSSLALLLGREPARAPGIADAGARLAATEPEAALLLVEAAADTMLLNGSFSGAAVAFEAFVARQTAHVPALTRLVGICADGGLDSKLSDAQARLVDAYLAEQRGADALPIAEALAARHPDSTAHKARLHRARALAAGQTRPVSEPLVSGAVETPTPAGVREAGSPPSGRGIRETPSIAAKVEPQTKANTGHDQADPQNPFGLGPIAIDLGDILGDELTPPPARQGRPATPRPSPPDAGSGAAARAEAPQDLDQVFQNARDDASRQAIGDGAERHYKVALAYQDVGMTAEAIKALELAVRAPRVRFEAASLLARLLLGRGDRREAIEWFERAAEAPAPTLEASRSLLYDLGGALESSGEHARALAVFLELQTEAGEYRDVARRVDRLRRDQAGG